MKPYIIKRIYLDHVLENNKVLYNTNNHEYSVEQSKPPDYYDRLNLTKTKHWINKFHSNYYKITLDSNDMNWLRKALHIGSQTNRFSHIFDDELANICKKYENHFPKIDNQGFFIRTDKVSLKEGVNGLIPYTNFKDIIESMVTTKPGHMSFDYSDTECTIYFLPWQILHPNKEFRVFVHNNNITAISDQHLYTVNHYFNTLTDSEIFDILDRILKYFDSNIKEKLAYLNSYTYDFAILDNDEEYFIEPNGFGKYYSAGSALYHWIYDHDTLHESDIIEFRYVNEY